MKTRSTIDHDDDDDDEDFAPIQTPVTTMKAPSSGQRQLLLQNWMDHDSIEFHFFSPSEASEIRGALLVWYALHRRKLPWRCDPPPWDGSTAAAYRNPNGPSNDKKTKNQKTPVNNNNSSIKDFFAVKKKKPSSSTTKNKKQTKAQPSNDDDEAFTKTFPVTAYGVWVSEIMLQQTRVEAVIPYWVKWMTAFPTVHALAAATPEQVNAHWAGLGFYRRARLLHQAAQKVVTEMKGKVPQTVDELLQLPGVGRYTASAIASIAYNVSVPVVDGNVCRVLSRLRGIANHVKAPALKDVWAWTLAEQLVNATTTALDNTTAATCSSAGGLNQALMELGATYCAPSGTGVDPNDPLKDFYSSTRLGREMAARCSLGAGLPISAAAATTKTTSKNDNAAIFQTCPVCAENGVSEAFDQLQSSVQQELDASGCSSHPSVSNKGTISNLPPAAADAAATCGHRVFPLAPPKNAKREEVLAVAVLSTKGDESSAERKTGNDRRWLLVKRPDTGLLAGQWEFPCVCVWNSDHETTYASSTNETTTSKKTKKRKDMSDQVPLVASSVRRRALNKFMQEIAVDDDCNAVLQLPFQGGGPWRKRSTNSEDKSTANEPLEHVFSHVRHTMWIEEADVPVSSVSSLEWTDSSSRKVRWMSLTDMQQVGVTSGVKKILKAVGSDEGKSSVAKNR